MRAKKAAINSTAMFIYMLVFIISGLILPRLILSRFGSGYNGVIASINQFISYISLLAAGVAGATRAALYKPLAERDTIRISGIIRATEFFFRKVALMFLGILMGIAVLYPLLISGDFDWVFVFSLTLILGIGTFFQYFFGATYQTLLIADQRAYISTLARTGAVMINVSFSIFLVLSGFEIRIVMLASSIVFAIYPFLLNLYIHKRYKLDSSVPPDNSAINQRWDAFVHQLAYFVHVNAGIVIVTVFLGIKEASVYVVYIFIIRAIKMIIVTVAGVGIEAPFGDMLAKNEHKALQAGFKINEFLVVLTSTLMLTCSALLIVPFVAIYTTGVYDANYYQPLFAIIACAAEFVFIARIPPQSLVNAAGHYRQTRNGAIAEVAINIVLSLIFVQLFGLAGVAFASFCAILFRTVQISFYASNHIVKRNLMVFVWKMLLSILTAGVVIVLVSFLPPMVSISYLSWALYALQVFGIALGVTGLVAVIFYQEELRILWRLACTLSDNKRPNISN